MEQREDGLKSYQMFCGRIEQHYRDQRVKLLIP